MNADAIVLGAGIIGAAIARELAVAGLGVIVVEAGEPGTGTSGRCDGNVLVQTKHDDLGVRMTLRSIHRYREWVRDLDAPLRFEQPGSLVFFTDPAQLATGAERVAWLTGLGVRAECLAPDQIRDAEPNLAHHLVGGIDCADDASVYPPAVVGALLRDAQRRGALILRRTRAIRLRSGPGGAVTGVDTTAGPVSAPWVVNAMGIWSADLDDGAGIDLPIQPRQGVLAVTAEAPGLVRRAVTEARYLGIRAGASRGDRPDTAFVAEPTYRGNILVGSSRGFVGRDTSVDVSLVGEIMRRAISFVPAMARLSVIRTFAGLRPWTPDNRPLIGAARERPGYVYATGHEGEGIGLAPITADLVTGLVLGEPGDELADAVLAVADPNRFARTGSGAAA